MVKNPEDLQTDSSFGANLRRLRLLSNLSIQALAEKATLSVPFLSDLERGRKEPSLATLRKLSVGLALPLSELVREEPQADGWVSRDQLLAQIAPLLSDSYPREDALLILAGVGALANFRALGSRLAT